MTKKFVKGRQYRIITQGMGAGHSFKMGEIVTAEENSLEEVNLSPFTSLVWATNGTFENIIGNDDVEEVPDQRLPKWGDLLPQERHQLLGEIVDAMIYNGRAVIEVQDLVNKFKNAGYVRSVILPIENPETN